MSHIVNPQRSNVCLQILLEINVYITFIWAACYPIDMFYVSMSERERQSVNSSLFNFTQNNCIVHLGMELAYILVLGIEWLRLYISFTINLCCSSPHPKMLLLNICVACAPLLLALHYLSSKTCGYTINLLMIIWNLWYVCIVLQVLVIVGNSWWRHKLEQRV